MNVLKTKKREAKKGENIEKGKGPAGTKKKTLIADLKEETSGKKHLPGRKSKEEKIGIRSRGSDKKNLLEMKRSSRLHFSLEFEMITYHKGGSRKFEIVKVIRRNGVQK